MVYCVYTSVERSNKQNHFVIAKCSIYEILRSANEVYHIYEVHSRKTMKKGGVKMYEKFCELLEKSNKTTYRVSKDTGISQSIFADWKSGRIKVLGAKKLKILAEYFNVSIEYFLE